MNKDQEIEPQKQLEELKARSSDDLDACAYLKKFTDMPEKDRSLLLHLILLRMGHKLMQLERAQGAIAEDICAAIARVEMEKKDADANAVEH